MVVTAMNVLPKSEQVNNEQRIVLSNPLVTAIICNYNYGRYLGEAIESALNQTWNNMEIIVVDDGSTDDSRSILKKYEGRIRIILKENDGQASAFNAGVAETRGEIICFLDSDDFWHPEKVEQTVCKYREGPYGLVCNDLQDVDEQGNPISGLTHSQTNNINFYGGYLLEYLEEHGVPWTFSPTSGMSLPKHIIQKIFPLPEKEWRICADNPLAFAAICHGPVGIIKEPLGYYRYHGSNSFAVRHRRQADFRIMCLVNRAKRYIFIQKHLSAIGLKRFKKDLKYFYPYYRSCCFITRNRPWHYLITLWKRNIQHHFMNRQDILVPMLNTFMYFLLDSVLCLLMFVHLPTPYEQLRDYYRQVALSLNLTTRAYLEHD